MWPQIRLPDSPLRAGAVGLRAFRPRTPTRCVRRVEAHGWHRGNRGAILTIRSVVVRCGLILASVAVTAVGCFGGGSGSPPPTSLPVGGVTLLPRSSAGCAAAIVHHDAAPIGARHAGIPPTIPWVEDAQAQITGSLFYYTPTLRRHTHAIIGTRGRGQGGTATKILWWIRGNGSPTLTIVGHRIDATGSFHQTITGPSLGRNTTFPSIVTIPTPGCWTLDLRSGSTSGSITFRALTLDSQA